MKFNWFLWRQVFAWRNSDVFSFFVRHWWCKFWKIVFLCLCPKIISIFIVDVALPIFLFNSHPICAHDSNPAGLKHAFLPPLNVLPKTLFPKQGFSWIVKKGKFQDVLQEWPKRLTISPSHFFGVCLVIFLLQHNCESDLANFRTCLSK